MLTLGLNVFIIGPPGSASNWLDRNGLPIELVINEETIYNGQKVFPYYAFNRNLGEQIDYPIVSLGGGLASFVFYSGREDVSYLIETSTDLESWTEQGIIAGSAPDEDHSRLFIGLENDRRFVRFRLEKRTQ